MKWLFVILMLAANPSWAQSIVLDPAHPDQKAVQKPVVATPAKPEQIRARGALIRLISAQRRAYGTLINIRAQVPISHFRSNIIGAPNRIVIDMSNTSIKRRQKRAIPSPAGLIRLGVHGKTTRLVVDVGGNRVPKFKATTTKNGLQIWIGKVLVKKPVASISNRLITLDFRDAEVRNVIDFIAKMAHVNIVVSDTVTGKVTIRLTQVNWRTALEAVLNVKHLKKIESGGVVRVVTKKEHLPPPKQKIVPDLSSEVDVSPAQTPIGTERPPPATSPMTP